MSANNQKKVVVTRKSDSAKTASVTRMKSKTPQIPLEFVYKKQNFIIAGIGVALMIIGFFLMAGGHMPSPDVWDPKLIYSTRIVVISPIFILAGLGVVTYSIFKK